jgi:antitoxin component YwqK of YwqJK toxin-antitoxin module
VLQFQNNKEEGKATEYAEDGRIITKLTYKNGFIFTEERINRFNSEGRRTGIWQDLYDNQILKEEGPWTNGLRNGVFKFFDRKGKLERMELYENGELKEGGGETAIMDLRQEFYEDGTLKVVGSYSDGKRKGTFREYDQSGKEIKGYLYDNDVKIGEGNGG